MHLVTIHCTSHLAATISCSSVQLAELLMPISPRTDAEGHDQGPASYSQCCAAPHTPVRHQSIAYRQDGKQPCNHTELCWTGLLKHWHRGLRRLRRPELPAALGPGSAIHSAAMSVAHLLWTRQALATRSHALHMLKLASAPPLRSSPPPPPSRVVLEDLEAEPVEGHLQHGVACEHCLYDSN
jgi:hypothetical protein